MKHRNRSEEKSKSFMDKQTKLVIEKIFREAFVGLVARYCPRMPIVPWHVGSMW